MSKDAEKPEPYENGAQDGVGSYAEFSEGGKGNANDDDKDGDAKIVRLNG